MHAIERELIKASGYTARKKYTNRQDYLGSILNAVLKLSDDAFDALSDEAATWANSAVEAKNAKQDIDDFDETVVDDETADTDDDDTGVDDSDDSDSDDDADTDDDGDDTDSVDDDTDADEDEDEKPSKRKVKAKAEKPAKTKPPAKEKTKAKAAPQKGKRPPQFDKDDVDLDKFGSMKGSKNSQALAMFEKGATTKEVKEALGGTYYNILKRCVEQGHVLDKKGAVITLTHKDEVGKKPAASVAKKKPKK